MKKIRLTTLATGVSLLAMATCAEATLYNFDYSASRYVGSSFSEGFDLSSVLNDPGLSYHINSAQLSFTFHDDNSGEISLAGVTTTEWTGNISSGFDRDQTASYVDEGETAGIAIGGSLFTTSSNYYSQTQYTGTQITYGDHPYTVQTGGGYWQTYRYSCGLWSTCTGSYWVPPTYSTSYAQDRTHHYDNTSGGTGAFGLTVGADPLMLTSLANGYLGFNITSLWGDFIFDKATLTADISSAVRPVPPAPTPEPATMLLMGTGLVGIIGIRKKQRSA